MFPQEKKVSLELEERTEVLSIYGMGKKIKKILGFQDVWEFYRSTVEKALT